MSSTAFNNPILSLYVWVFSSEYTKLTTSCTFVSGFKPTYSTPAAMDLMVPKKFPMKNPGRMILCHGSGQAINPRLFVMHILASRLVPSPLKLSHVSRRQPLTLVSAEASRVSRRRLRLHAPRMNKQRRDSILERHISKERVMCVQYLRGTKIGLTWAPPCRSSPSVLAPKPGYAMTLNTVHIPTLPPASASAFSIFCESKLGHLNPLERL